MRAISASIAVGSVQRCRMATRSAHRRHRRNPCATVMRSTGWQPHTVRGFLAAVVRKSSGFGWSPRRPTAGACIGSVRATAQAPAPVSNSLGFGNGRRSGCGPPSNVPRMQPAPCGPAPVCAWTYNTPLDRAGATARRHHPNPAEAHRRWRGKRSEPVSSVSVLTTHALFPLKVQRKVSNDAAGLAAAGSSLDRPKIAAIPPLSAIDQRPRKHPC
jgi:hypothetical protein